MPNELLIILSFIVIYGGVVLFYRFFGKNGLLAFNVMATLLANVEVLILVRAFGVEMTLGNVLFASTFLITDIMSENHTRKDANRAVVISTICSVFFIMLSQMWLLYTPSENDWASGAFHTIFSSTPRIVCASLGVYLVSQLTDVWLYHKWWDWCRKRFGDNRKGLWIRNNGSTMISQLLNTFLYTFLAFYGTYPMETLVTIFTSSYIIYFVTSLLDTPFVYWCRKINEGRKDGTD
ncbi:MAG: queuosine precursor transporter [Bacteroidales bacterium]|nr:queuosine precursor transporter [Bacteroidales bacterium]